MREIIYEPAIRSNYLYSGSESSRLLSFAKFFNLPETPFSVESAIPVALSFDNTKTILGEKFRNLV